ncbi:50S ribosomal protein L21 [Candidatus Falkowbacteria bacterium]|nr:50S ribosomal protein L21 [Candidatus Falkowbacteria bacterium]
MSSIAIITTGGKQYIVKQGDKLDVERLAAQATDKVSFDTLLTADAETGKLNVGSPFLSTKVTGKVEKQFKDDKITVIKFKSKIRYRRKIGHRQHKTLVSIVAL